MTPFLRYTGPDGWRHIFRAPGALMRVLADRVVYPAQLRAAGVVYGPGLTLVGRPDVRMSAGGKIVLGNDVHLYSRPDSNPLRLVQPCTLALLRPKAAIEIGDCAALTGVVVCAAVRVDIGRRTLVGANCRILDTDFHPLSDEMRRVDRNAGAACAPVSIGSDCFLGTGVIVLKGTRLGDGCVVGAGAVLSGAFPSRSLIVGNPARVVRRAHT